MQRRLFALLPLVLAIATGPAILSSSQAATGPAAVGRSANLHAALHPAAPVCYSQTTTATGNAINSQRQPAASGLTTVAADDFKLSATCKATAIDVPGTYYLGTGAMGRVQIRFYYDNAGVPGAIKATRVVLSSSPNFTDVAGTLHVGWWPQQAKVNLPVGQLYWVSVQARQVSAQPTLWGWSTITPQIGHQAVFQNPGGAFGVCATWQTLNSCFGLPNEDFGFILYS